MSEFTIVQTWTPKEGEATIRILPPLTVPHPVNPARKFPAKPTVDFLASDGWVRRARLGPGAYQHVKDGMVASFWGYGAGDWKLEYAGCGVSVRVPKIASAAELAQAVRQLADAMREHYLKAAWAAGTLDAMSTRIAARVVSDLKGETDG